MFVKLTWVEYLAAVLLAIGLFFCFSLSWLPLSIANLLHTGGGEFTGMGEAFIQLTLGGASIAAGILLFAIRPLLLFRSRVLPPLVILGGIALMAEQTSVCRILWNYGNLNGACEVFAPGVCSGVIFSGVIYAIRTWQIFRKPEPE